jgi:hypothetical protein
MDIVINSAIQSPLIRTLSSTKGKAKNFTNHLKDNVPPVSFGKVEISPDGGSLGGYGRNYKFKIPQYGYLRGFLLKFTAGELGLGDRLIQDVYNSIVDANQYYCSLLGQNSNIQSKYDKTSMFATERVPLPGSMDGPQTQSIVPQGWVSPFDGNVRSGNFDPWESMWTRLRGGYSYGISGVPGVYPAPVKLSAKGDARIAPFRQVARMPVLNAFGRNVHNLGNPAYDAPNPLYNFSTDSNGGYLTRDAVPGQDLPGSYIATIQYTNQLGYYATSSSSIVSGTIDSTNSYPYVNPSDPTISTINGVTGTRSQVPFNSVLGDRWAAVSNVAPGVDNVGTISDNLASSVTTSGVPYGAVVDTTKSCGFYSTSPASYRIPYWPGTSSLANNLPTSCLSEGNCIYGNANITFANLVCLNGTFSGVPTDGGGAISFTRQAAGDNFFVARWGPNASPTFVSNVPHTVSTDLFGQLTTLTNAPIYLNGIAADCDGTRSGVPYNVRTTDTFACDAGSQHFSFVEGVPRGCSNNDSSSLCGALTTASAPKYLGRSDNLPVNCSLTTCPTGTATTIPQVPYNVTTGSFTGYPSANNLTQSSAIDYSFIAPMDGCVFQQIPYYNPTAGPGGIGLSTTQPLPFSINGGVCQTAQAPYSNSNTQMRNRYLGQRLASTYDWCSQANLSKHLGAMMVSQITLSTHSRIIQTIYPMETLARVYRMNTDAKRKWLALIRPHIIQSPSSIQRGDTNTPGYTGSVNTSNVEWQRDNSYTTYRRWTCYFPCFFSFFEEPGNNLDTRFIENLDIDVLVNTTQNIYDACDLGIHNSNLGTVYSMDNMNEDRSCMTTYSGYNTQEFRKRVSVIDQDNLSVSAICYFHNFHDSTNESIRRLNYKPNIPSHLLGYNTYREHPVFLTASDIVNGATINVNLQCTNLVFEIIFMIRRVQKDIGAHPQLESFPFENFSTTLPISSVAFTGSGQLLYQATGAECLLADQWDFSLGSIQSGMNTTNDTSIYADAHESYYTQSKRTCDGFFGYRIGFSFSQDRSYNSGSVAFETLNNPILTVTIPPLHGWVIQDDNLAFQMGSLFNLSENLNQRECDTQTVFDNDFQLEIYENYFQLNRIDSNTGVLSKSLDM